VSEGSKAYLVADQSKITVFFGPSACTVQGHAAWDGTRRRAFSKGTLIPNGAVSSHTAAATEAGTAVSERTSRTSLSLEPPQLSFVEILLLLVGHVLKEAWQPVEQNGVVLPQYPEAEQQSP
jgi:hypothetical protein